MQLELGSTPAPGVAIRRPSRMAVALAHSPNRVWPRQPSSVAGEGASHYARGGRAPLQLNSYGLAQKKPKLSFRLLQYSDVSRYSAGVSTLPVVAMVPPSSVPRPAPALADPEIWGRSRSTNYRRRSINHWRRPRIDYRWRRRAHYCRRREHHAGQRHTPSGAKTNSGLGDCNGPE